MTPVEQSGPLRGPFVRAVLPWLLGGTALLVYLLTLNPWLSLYSLGAVARVEGWLWQPALSQPLTSLVFAPFRLLPESWVPLAMNLFTAGCGALVLVLLARSVVIWPRLERRRRKDLRLPTHAAAGVVPPVIAVLVCGLQLTFWEQATSASGEMLDLLLFAYVIRAVLEFKLDGRESWLARAALLYGAGMANNWALIGFFPLFAAGVMAAKGLEFWKPRFIARMAFWGLGGASLYLWLPAVHSLSSTAHVDFWPALKGVLKMQTDGLASFPRPTFVVLALTCLAPLLITIPWRRESTEALDHHPVSLFVTQGGFHFAHAALLLFIIWLALDIPFSPRNLMPGMPLLTYSYLSALVAGYCAGYLLLIHTVRINQRAARAMLLCLWVLAALLMPVFAWRNLGQVRGTNTPALRDYARQLFASLPDGKSVVLSDDPAALYLLRAEVAAQGRKKEPLLLDTRSLPLGEYQLFLSRRYKERWPGGAPADPKQGSQPRQLIALVEGFSAAQPVIYLHPSFGYFFEAFVERPYQAVHYLARRALEDPAIFRLDEPSLAANETYWEDQWSAKVSRLATKRPEDAGEENAGRPKGALSRLGLARRSNLTLAFVAGQYSRSLNDWGTRLQQAGRLEVAALWFKRALELKPDNLSARLNLEYHQTYLASGRSPERDWLAKAHGEDLLGRYHAWDMAMRENGPVDEPSLLLKTAVVFFTGGNYRQAAASYARAGELAPGWPEARFGQARSLLALGDCAGVLRLGEMVENGGTTNRVGSPAEGLCFRVLALQCMGRTNEAAAALEAAVSQHQDNPEVLSMAAQLFVMEGRLPAALTLFNRLLAENPDSPGLLANKGFAELELLDYGKSIQTLSAALALAPTNHLVRLNRAVACLRAGELDIAESDYRQLLQVAPAAPALLSGLGEIAWRRGNTNAARAYFAESLSNSVPNSGERRLAQERLRQLKRTSSN